MTETPERDDLFDPQVKGRVDPIARLARQLERCNMVLVMGDVVTFENSVLALKGDLPMSVKEAVLARKGEFNSAPVRYEYMTTCGVNIGTPKNPFVSVPGHPEWDFLLDIPKPYRDAHMEDKITILSPTRIKGEITDYIDLYEIIKEELEKAGLTWRYGKGDKGY